MTSNVKKGRLLIPVRGGMTVRVYTLLDRCVEEGIAHGWRRAHKHTDAPGEEAIKDHISGSIMAALEEYFDLDDGVE